MQMSFEKESNKNILDIFRDKNLVKICAPMVRYSKLQFRNLVKLYDCDLNFTPMILADSFCQSEKARNNEFTTNFVDTPLIVQFAANTVHDFVGAAYLASPYCNGVDLNCGCPQRWAKEQKLGCELLKNPQLVYDIVRQCRNRISKPFTIYQRHSVMKSFIILYLFLGTFLEVLLTLLPSPLDGTLPTIELPGENKLKINQKDIEEAIEFAKSMTQHLERLEETIHEPSQIVPDSPAHGAFMFLEPDWIAIERGRNALVAQKASQQLAYSVCFEHNFDLNQLNNHFRQISFQSTSLTSICNHLNRTCSHEERLNSYRSIDGACNHANQGSIGESYTAYARFFDAQYLNSFGTPKRSVTKSQMPSSRLISSKITRHDYNPHEYLTLAFTQWGQFVEHDLSRFTSSVMIHYNDSFRCCDDFGFMLAPRFTHPLCMPISIPTDDEYYKEKDLQCMSYVRSLPALRPDCSLGHLEQLNQATHFLDGSQIYGPTPEKSLQLRERQKGKLKSFVANKMSFLPLEPDVKKHCLVNSTEDICFDSGDSRVNFMPQLTVMHTLWMREHNRLAEALAAYNEDWDDETIFQEARRIVIAEMQHITYNEWMNYLLDERYYFSQKKVENPTVSNEFAVAAIRALYSMIPKDISLLDETYIENSTISLVNHFNNPGIMVTQFDSIIRGLVNQRAQKIGVHYSEDITNNLFSDSNYGYDLLSFDIQRGRDHGLSGYNAYRSLCGLKKGIKFKDFNDAMTKSSSLTLSRVYKHVDDVDFIVGGLMEEPVNSLLGPTFSCIIADQFRRTKNGDNYFYTNIQQPKSFTYMQLNEIRKVTLARIICDNSDIKNIQPDVFRIIDHNNEPLSCDVIPEMDLVMWYEGRETYLI